MVDGREIYALGINTLWFLSIVRLERSTWWTLTTANSRGEPHNTGAGLEWNGFDGVRLKRTNRPEWEYPDWAKGGGIEAPLRRYRLHTFVYTLGSSPSMGTEEHK